MSSMSLYSRCPKKGYGYETIEIHRWFKKLGCFWQLFKSIQVTQVCYKSMIFIAALTARFPAKPEQTSDMFICLYSALAPVLLYLLLLGTPELASEGGDTGQVRPPPWMICKNCIDLTFHPVGALVIILKYLQLKIWFLVLDVDIYRIYETYTHTFRAT